MHSLSPTAALTALALFLWSASPAVAQNASRSSAPADDTAVLRAYEEKVSRSVDKAAAVTVSIKVDREKDTATRPARQPGNPGGGVFGIRPEDPVSGTIIDPDGWIATSYFNVEGHLNKIEVTLPDGTVHPAELTGWHRQADIALLKIPASGLPTLPFADGSDLRAGDALVAVGRGPDGRGVTANPGILSAAGRHLGRSVQIDCRLNFGNVGGPLVNLDGRLVGMTNKVNMISAEDRGQNSGVGFALVTAKIAELLPGLKKGEKIQGGLGRPFLGVMIDQTYAGKDGVKITSALAGGSAQKAGFKAGDIIQAMDGVKIATFEGLRGEIQKRKIGDLVKVKLKRGEEELEIELALGENPQD